MRGPCMRRSSHAKQLISTFVGNLRYWLTVLLTTFSIFDVNFFLLQSDVALCDAVVFTILRHLSLSSAALTASCSVIPVELLMSLSHDVGGRPLFLFPLTFPMMIVLSSPFLRMTYPKKRNFRLRTISRSISLFPILSKTHALVFLSVHGILRTFL